MPPVSRADACDFENRQSGPACCSSDDRVTSRIEEISKVEPETTLGAYRIVSPLGAGGMGEVYRAHDPKLGRDVAVKVLPEEMSADPERIARFQREARALATLQHPNIASIYGFEEDDDHRFLVMELVEGQDLSERLKAGPIPVDEAVALALQLTDGLAAAHEQGIIHRDLKPANIKITPDGGLKILDFGLARAFTGDPEGEDDLHNSPTITAAMTQAGVILGTAAYMSPEQARGEAVDQRADIWAFGVILFEMLTGKQFFAGNTVSDTLAAVLRAELDWDLLAGGHAAKPPPSAAPLSDPQPQGPAARCGRRPARTGGGRGTCGRIARRQTLIRHCR